jgi:hypothetical protein
MPPTAGKASWQSQAESVWGEAITTQSKRRKNAKTAHRDFTDQSLTCADPLKNEARVCLLRIRRPVSTPGRDAVGSNRARRVARQWALHRFELRLRGRDPGSGASVMIGATAREDSGALGRSAAPPPRCGRERELGLNQHVQGGVHGLASAVYQGARQTRILHRARSMSATRNRQSSAVFWRRGLASVGRHARC